MFFQNKKKLLGFFLIAFINNMVFSCSVTIHNDSDYDVIITDLAHSESAHIPKGQTLENFGDPHIRAHFIVAIKQNHVFKAVKEVKQTACTATHIINININEVLQTNANMPEKLGPVLLISPFSQKAMSDRMHKTTESEDMHMQMGFVHGETVNLILAQYERGIPFKEKFQYQYNEPGRAFSPSLLEDHDQQTEFPEDSQQITEASGNFHPRPDLE